MNIIFILLCVLVALAAMATAYGVNRRGIKNDGLYAFLGMIIGACIVMGIYASVAPWKTKPTNAKLPTGYEVVTDGKQHYRFRHSKNNVSVIDCSSYAAAVEAANHHVEFLQNEKNRVWVTVSK